MRRVNAKAKRQGKAKAKPIHLTTFHLEDPKEYHSKAEAAFWKLSPKVRDKIRAEGTFDSYEDWFASRKDLIVIDKPSGKAISGEIKIIGKAADKFLAKDIKRTAQQTALEKIGSPYRALLIPAVIVPDDLSERAIIADAGSIVKLADQTIFYRDRVSPITQRADETLVHYGKSNKQKLGWLASTIGTDKTAWKPIAGSTFLVQTRNEGDVKGWDRVRFLVSKAHKKYPTLVDWLASNATEHRTLIREVIRSFGGKVLKSQDDVTRSTMLLEHILHTEIDMKTAKKDATKKLAKTPKNAEKIAFKSNKNAKTKTAKPSKKGKGPPRANRDLDNHIIKRLTDGGASPFRAGTAKERQWKMLKKGMTLIQLVEKGGRRGDINWYVKHGWVKLLRPKNDSQGE